MHTASATPRLLDNLIVQRTAYMSECQVKMDLILLQLMVRMLLLMQKHWLIVSGSQSMKAEISDPMLVCGFCRKLIYG